MQVAKRGRGRPSHQLTPELDERDRLIAWVADQLVAWGYNASKQVYPCIADEASRRWKRGISGAAVEKIHKTRGRGLSHVAKQYTAQARRDCGPQGLTPQQIVFVLFVHGGFWPSNLWPLPGDERPLGTFVANGFGGVVFEPTPATAIPEPELTESRRAFLRRHLGNK
jgi:hypothetical protein